MQLYNKYYSIRKFVYIHIYFHLVNSYEWTGNGLLFPNTQKIHIIREGKSKPQWDITLSLLMAISKKTRNNKHCEDVEKREP